MEVIILTGHGSDREETVANELGAFAYLHKPIDLYILSRTMREAYQKVSDTRAAMQRGRDAAGDGAKIRRANGWATGRHFCAHRTDHSGK